MVMNPMVESNKNTLNEHTMAPLGSPGLKVETFSGLHVKSHDQLKGAVRE